MWIFRINVSARFLRHNPQEIIVLRWQNMF